MTHLDYAEIARQDPTWCEIAGSFAIEGMAMNHANEVIAGRMIAGEIDVVTAVQIIRQDAGLSLEA